MLAVADPSAKSGVWKEAFGTEIKSACEVSALIANKNTTVVTMQILLAVDRDLQESVLLIKNNLSMDA